MEPLEDKVGMGIARLQCRREVW